MNDSIEAFQSPQTISKGIRSLAIRRKKNPVSKQLQILLKKESLNEKVFVPNCSNSNTDDTMHGIDDLENDGSKEITYIEKSYCAVQDTRTLSPTTGFCSVCKTNIPKAECPTHYAACLNKTFSSKYSMKLSSVVVCSTCGNDIQVIDYPSHVEACKKSNVEVAKCLSIQDEVTSSYFSKTFLSESASNNFCCPSCGTNLSSLNNLQRTRHVNMCLDSSEHKASSIKSEVNLCEMCKKSFKTARGLKLHSKVCSGNSLQTKRKRKVRVPRNADEELLQLAKGLSASNHLTEKMIIKQEKQRKRELPIPALLQVTDSSRKANLRARLDSLVSDVVLSESEIASTPRLPGTEQWQGDEFLTEQSGTRKNLPKKEVEKVVFQNSSLNSDLNNDVCKEQNGNSEHKTSFAINVAPIKWDLGTKQSNTNADYRVSGLLSQFDRSIPYGNVDVEKHEPVQDEAELLDSTLNCLIDLDKGDSGNQCQKKRGQQHNADPTQSYFLPKNPLRSDISSLFNQSKYSDLKLIFVDGILHVHKCILFARCPRFLEVLERRLDENNSVSLDLALKDFKVFFQHLYSGSFEDRDGILKSCFSLETILMQPSNLQSKHPSEPQCSSTNFELSPLQVQFSQAPSSGQPRPTDSAPNGPVSGRCEREFLSTASYPGPYDHPVACVMSDGKSPASCVKSDDEPTVACVMSDEEPPFACVTSDDVLPVAFVISDDKSPACVMSDNEPPVACVMSDDDLFSSFTGKPHNLSRDSTRSHSKALIGHCNNRVESKKSCGPDHLSSSCSSSSDELLSVTFNHQTTNSQTSLRSPTSCSAKLRTDRGSFSQPVMRDHQSFAEDSLARASVCLNEEPNTNHSRMFKTPNETRKSKSSRPIVPITPMPNFSEMDTPEVITRGRRIGLKKSLGKRKMKVKLREVHAYTHQVESSSEDEGSMDSKQTLPSRDPPITKKNEIASSVDISPDSSDDDLILVAPQDEDRKKGQKKATQVLDAMPDEEFELAFKNCLHSLHEKGVLMKALKREDNFMNGIPIGSKRDLGMWMQRVTPDNRYFREEWPILLDLSASKHQILVNLFSVFMVETPQYSSYQCHHLFSILPVIYRGVIKLNPNLNTLVT